MKTTMCVVLALGIAACSNDDNTGPTGEPATPRQACTDIAQALCERLYACLSPAEITAGGFPPAQSDCVAMVEARKSCSTITAASACPVGTYQPNQAAECGDQTASLTCDQIRVPGFKLETAAPACGAICQ
jgi:hypothetical protein